MANPAVDRLAAGKYVSLTTFKRDGTAVATPVWFARDGDTLVVMTDPTSGKVKRLRNSGAVRVAPCDMRGRVHGEPVDGTAELLDDAGTRDAVALIGARYGLTFRLFELANRLRRRETPRIGIRVTL